MSEKFQVGQWVTCEGKLFQIGEVDGKDGTVLLKYGDRQHLAVWMPSGDVEPFRWQVGRTYRTTLDGVTATITSTECGKLYGGDSRSKRYEWGWSGSTGLLIGMEQSIEGPHLLPHLADESPPVAAAATPLQVGQWVRHHDSDKPGVIAWIDGRSVCVRYDNGTAVYEASVVEPCGSPPVSEAATEPIRFETYEEFETDESGELSALESLHDEFKSRQDKYALMSAEHALRADQWRKACDMVRRQIERAGK